jgi:uncharacterized protein (DUF2141 family)
MHLGVLLGGLLLASNAYANGKLIINFEGMETDAGLIACSLINAPEQFLSRQHRLKRCHGATISADKAAWAIDNLTYGNCAISAYHDADINGEVDGGLIGIPTESQGFSNNARGSFGPSDHEEAEFEFTQPGQVLTIQID